MVGLLLNMVDGEFFITHIHIIETTLLFSQLFVADVNILPKMEFKDPTQREVD